MILSKLDGKLDDKTVKFTDYAIDKHQYDFDNVKAKSISIKFRVGWHLQTLSFSVTKYVSPKFMARLLSESINIMCIKKTLPGWIT